MEMGLAKVSVGADGIDQECLLESEGLVKSVYGSCLWELKKTGQVCLQVWIK